MEQLVKISDEEERRILFLDIKIRYEVTMSSLFKVYANLGQTNDLLPCNYEN